jgi:hypothetical protein
MKARAAPPAAPRIATEEVIAASTTHRTAAGVSGGHGVEIKPGPRPGGSAGREENPT